VVILLLCAFVAGAARAVSPCVLPVLPVALSAGVSGGRRRPLGIAAGLTVAFAFSTVAAVYVIDLLDLADDTLRTLAIVVLALTAALLVLPALGDRIEAALSRLVPTGVLRRAAGNGLWSGFGIGIALGFVYAPCAGPVLAAVITLSAAQPLEARRVLIAVTYAVGSGAALYVLILGGRRLSAPLLRHTRRVQLATAAVLALAAAAVAGNLDTRFQTEVTARLPGFVVDPSGALERTTKPQERLRRRRDGTAARAPFADAAHAAPSGSSHLPILGRAPDLVASGRWFNTVAGRPLVLRELRGRVVLLDFWTYSCINCIRTFPRLRAWDRRYRADGLTTIGVHSPEFPFERDPGNVRDAIERSHIDYPVMQDNDLATWRAYDNAYWPAQYLVDAQGRVRYAHVGEGDDDATESALRGLLAEAGRARLPKSTRTSADDSAPSLAQSTLGTPESYLGADRAARFANGKIVPGTRTFRAPARPLELHELAFDGRWSISAQEATAVGGARLRLRFLARDVFIVLGTQEPAAEQVDVRLDGRSIPSRSAGSDVEHGRLTVSSYRLYRLVRLPQTGSGVLDLRLPAGVRAYAVSFG
jgi:cytochrome c biogenesis protein CcdA/thiol-disulfide isomerase/thioredoxin